MKVRKFVTLTLWSLFVIGAASLYAQSVHELRVKIPFEFVVSNKTMEAGEYSLQTVATALQIRQRNGHLVAMVPYNSSPKAETFNEGQLLFHRYGDTYFLSEISMPFSNIGNKLFQTKRERELAQAGSSRQELAVTVRSR